MEDDLRCQATSRLPPEPAQSILRLSATSANTHIGLISVYQGVVSNCLIHRSDIAVPGGLMPPVSRRL